MNSERKCQCEYCQKWMPLFRRLERKANCTDKRLIEEFLQRDEMVTTDLGAAEAKLTGDWPGWEWMKGYVGERVFAFQDGDGI